MNRRSLRFQMTAWYAAVLAFTFAIVGVGIWIALQQSIRETVDKELRARLGTIRPYIDEQTMSKDVSHLLEELGEQSVLTPAANYLKIADPSGRWIYRSPGTESWDIRLPSAARLPARGRTQTIRVRHGQLRVLTAPLRIGIVQIALPVDELEEVQSDFLWTVALGSPILLLLASMGGYWMSGRALAPLNRLAEAAERISAVNLSQRLPRGTSGDELDRLADVLNSMLSRLESAFRKITQFTADASHELRTPVAIIRTTAEVTQARLRTPEEYNAAWGVVITQTERTSKLLADLLTLARADSSDEQWQFESFGLAEVVSEACDEMRVLAEAKQVRIATSLDTTATVWGDRDALRRAVVVLLDNAVKATAAAGSITVTLQAEHGATQMATVRVRDTGIGIGPETLPYIFDRFYRASKDRSRESGGAGLGLSIAQWIITRHHGTIVASSQLGEGSTFTLCLPLDSRQTEL